MKSSEPHTSLRHLRVTDQKRSRCSKNNSTKEAIRSTDPTPHRSTCFEARGNLHAVTLKPPVASAHTPPSSRCTPTPGASLLQLSPSLPSSLHSGASAQQARPR